VDTFTKKEIAFLKKLNTPAKVQDYLNSLKFNFEKNGKSTFRSPLLTMRAGSAHCLEGATLAAYILSLHGHPPLVVHLEATSRDYDHVIAPFRVRGFWGALSKTNHSVLRYREPVYRDLRELVMSYFHEYFLKSGAKTLRRYSAPLNLNTFEPNWTTALEHLWGIDEALDEIKHYDIAPEETIKSLRKAEKIEIEAGEIVTEKAPKKVVR
jgi:hypothetical protein